MRTTYATDPAVAREAPSQQAGTTGRARRRRVTAILCAWALAAPGLLLGATPAQAANACTFTAHKPTYSHHNSSGVKVLNYKISVSCTKARDLTFRQDIMEDDDWPSDDDYLAYTTWDLEHYVKGESAYYDNYWTLPDTEVGNEEMYHEVYFREGSDGVWGPEYFVRSPVLQIAN
jgi:hypothetical protein